METKNIISLKFEGEESNLGEVILKNKSKALNSEIEVNLTNGPICLNQDITKQKKSATPSSPNSKASFENWRVAQRLRFHNHMKAIKIAAAKGDGPHLIPNNVDINIIKTTSEGISSGNSCFSKTESNEDSLPSPSLNEVTAEKENSFHHSQKDAGYFIKVLVEMNDPPCLAPCILEVQSHPTLSNHSRSDKATKDEKDPSNETARSIEVSLRKGSGSCFITSEESCSIKTSTGKDSISISISDDKECSDKISISKGNASCHIPNDNECFIQVTPDREDQPPPSLDKNALNDGVSKKVFPFAKNNIDEMAHTVHYKIALRSLELKLKKKDELELKDLSVYDLNPTLLYQFIEQKSWTTVVSRCTEAKHEASTWVIRYAQKENTPNQVSYDEKNFPVRWKMLPIHAAIVYNAPLDSIKSIVSAYPDGLKCGDDRKMTPLHLAAKMGMELENLIYLIDSFPQGIAFKDYKGRTPLRILIEYQKKCKDKELDRQKYEVLITLLRSRSELNIMDKERLQYEVNYETSRTTLISMIESKMWCETIKRCEEYSEEASVWLSCQEGNNVKQNKNESNVWRILPIHAAIVMHAPPEVVQALLLVHPMGAGASDDRLMLPLHMAFRLGSDLNTAYLIKNVYPEALYEENIKGQTPLDILKVFKKKYTRDKHDGIHRDNKYVDSNKLELVRCFLEIDDEGDSCDSGLESDASSDDESDCSISVADNLIEGFEDDIYKIYTDLLNTDMYFNKLLFYDSLCNTNHFKKGICTTPDILSSAFDCNGKNIKIIEETLNEDQKEESIELCYI